MWYGRRILRWCVLPLLALAGAWILGGEPSETRRGLPDPGGSGPAALEDDRGRRIPTGRRYRRVVSLVPALTQGLLELGLVDRLVARTEHDREPALRKRPSVGSATTPSLEVLLSSGAELVVTWADEGDPAVGARLRERGVAVYGARVATFDDLRRHLRALGLLLDRAERADSVVAAFDRRMAAASVPPPSGRRPTVVLPVWPEPLSVAGPGSFVDALIRRAGGVNAFGDLRRPWPVVDPETLLARQPDVLVVPVPDRGPSPWSLREPPWSHLDAVREGRIVRLPADLVERPTLRSPETVRRLRRALGRLVPDPGARP